MRRHVQLLLAEEPGHVDDPPVEVPDLGGLAGPHVLEHRARVLLDLVTDRPEQLLQGNHAEAPQQDAPINLWGEDVAAAGVADESLEDFARLVEEAVHDLGQRAGS